LQRRKVEEQESGCSDARPNRVSLSPGQCHSAANQGQSKQRRCANVRSNEEIDAACDRQSHDWAEESKNE
jgi:hypothetical protein